MEYKGKLYGKVHKTYFPLEATTEEWDAMVKRIAELEAENQALRQPTVRGSLPDAHPDTEADGYVFCGKCGKMK